MQERRHIFQKAALLLISILLMVSFPISVKAELLLTEEEKAYIAEGNVIRAISIDQAAPLQYTDSRGEIQGIAIKVFEKISEMTGLVFEYELFTTLDAALQQEYDLFFGISPNYGASDLLLSRPYLQTETIFFANSSLDLSNLDNKTYAGIRGLGLPEGVKEENVIYFDTREESLDAVEAGEADYGYANVYSVVYYTMQKGYKHVVTIPQGKETRDYGIAVANNNEVLLSIINKAIGAIDENTMHNLILEVASQIDKKVTYSMIIDAYGKEIFAAMFIVIGILLFCVVSYIRINNRLNLQNRRRELLEQISNEYLYEYFSEGDRLQLSEKCSKLFSTQESFEKAEIILKNVLHKKLDEGRATIELPFTDGRSGVFRLINFKIYDNTGRIVSIIGKLIDISEDVAEKEQLLTKSQIDGLTGLYNAATTKELIIERVQSKTRQSTDAFLLIDCDKFKQINDTYGHLVGNQILEHVSQSMKKTFSKSDIIGRFGGDEFCVYVKDAGSANLIATKCQQLNDLIGEVKEVNVTLSIGITLVNEETDYDVLFKKADDALYHAKRNGRAQTIFYSLKVLNGKE